MSTNINPNSSNASENKADHTLFGKDVALGQNAITPGVVPDTLYNAVDDKILKVDLSLGTKNKAPRSNAVISDTVESMPSGYSSLGVPTYGEGKINRVATWPTDDEQTGKGELSFFTPMAITSKDYDSLAN